VGAGTGTGPLSGSNLALASRYNLSAGLLLRWNLLYGLLMYAVACLMMGASSPCMADGGIGRRAGCATAGARDRGSCCLREKPTHI
jgi:hypothetical protein